VSKDKYPVIEKVRIEDIAAEGKSIARVDGRVLFVPYAVPGDLVDVQLTRKRKNYMEGYVVRYHEYSPIRVEPFCKHFGTCGGCKWQNLPYAEQLKIKQRQVDDQLRRIGRVNFPAVLPIIGSKKTTGYRNKLEFTFADRRWFSSDELARADKLPDEPALGYHIPGRFDFVFDVEECFLQPEPSNSIRLAVKSYANNHRIPFMNLRSHEGTLRNLIVRTSSAGDVMVILSVRQLSYEVEQLLGYMVDKFPQISSFNYVVNTKLNDTINDLEVVCYHGNKYITEEMEGIKFRVGPKSFYQTNSEQAYVLYSVVREFAGLTGNELVYDLYTGTGTIANFLARNARRVVGMEYVPEAIADAIENSKLNGITNTSFFTGDIKDLLKDDFVVHEGNPDVVVLDPPRAGVHPDVLKALLNISPLRVVYVSCNPATQARDVALLDSDYAVKRVQPVDMFPHTHHVENILLLERR
jgi:23S rRNA (uracil1939-C5)-methyltransferase